MTRLRHTLIPVAAMTIILVLLGAKDRGRYSQDVEWQLHENTGAGIRISYPKSWRVIIAKEQDEPRAAWSPTVLEQSELHKITFHEGAGVFWPGQYEIRILANPDSLDLEAFYARFDLSDLWNESAADSTIGGQPAKTWVRWSYDSLVREYLLVIPEGAVHILHDEHNSNDPEFKHHREIYKEMTSTFRVLSTPVSGNKKDTKDGNGDS